jgi:hypothetical protein
MIEILDH